ncbi:DNA polymerase IV [Oleiagrimonas sp. C23AA]|uniref:DNA polymerase IV n=1 Tax=Oleiagrimonas sp. C23AA TaxID=2719047 RepID=UPI001423636D|nr:DNA polymerase IV [Oleiagrimonas sp. C23AA]
MTAPPRKIIHVDMDAFYASVEQRDDPSLRGRPVVVAWRGARSVVCAASYEARPFGIHSAMPALRAERLCPQAVFVPPDFTRYRAVSAQIREIFSRHTALIEPLSLDEAYLDVSELRSGLPSATATAEAIRAAIREETQLTASAGVAPNKFLAKIASDHRKPDGIFVVRPSQVEDFLRELPVGRVPGVGKVMQRKLEALDIRTVGELRRPSLDELEQRFGRWGRRIYELARGVDERPVEPHRERVQVSAEDTFAEDLPLEALTPHIHRLAEKAWNGLTSKQGRIARTVVLKLKTADFQTMTRSLTRATPPSSAQELAELAGALRERVNEPAHTRYRLVGVGLAGLMDEGEMAIQGQLFDTF